MAMDDEKALMITCTNRHRGGWKTFPFIIGAKLAVGVASMGVTSNLTVYLIQQFNVPSINAAQINTIVTGSVNFAPVVGAIAADSGLGCFGVICGASVASLLGTLLFTLIAVVPSLRSPPCSSLGVLCEPPTEWQLAILYTSLTLVLAGLGGTRFISATLGAYQMDNDCERATFFNWYVIALYATPVMSLTLVIYVQVNAGWAWGFGMSTFLSAVGLILFLSGSRYYRHPSPKKNPFLVVLLRGVMPRKELKELSETSTLGCYNLLEDGSTEVQGSSACVSDRAMVHSEAEEIIADDCSSLIRLIPIMSTGILLALCASLLNSLTILQALVMECSFGPTSLFTIPASSMTVFPCVATITFAPLLEHAILPFWSKLSHRRINPLQRVGIGHLLTILALIAAAVTESKRLEALTLTNKPTFVLWLVPSLLLLGFGEALHFPGTLAFYHQEFPDSVTSLATGVIALVLAMGYYGSTATLGFVRKVTPWLQDDTDTSRLDNVYWMLAMVGGMNFGYFLICAKLYRKKGVEI